MVIPFYVLDIDLSAPTCGDGIVQYADGEQCDDGNMVSGDGCSSTCQLEAGHYCDEVEPNNTQATANSLDGCAGAVAQIMPLGDNDWFSFDVTVPGSSVTAVIDDGFGHCPGGFDSKIYLWSPQMTQLAADDDGAVPPCSKISPQVYPAALNLPVGTYAIQVQRYGNSATQSYYVLELEVLPPSCGDAIVQAGEQCDLGAMNGAPGSLCTAGCQFVNTYVEETEPNDTQATANPLPNKADGFIASINPIGDHDYFSFDVTVPGSSVTIRTGDGVGGCPAGADTVITLYDPGHTQIAANDDGGTPPCSMLAPATDPGTTNLAVGTYTVRVERYGDNAVINQYVIQITVEPPGCGDGVIQAGEQCDDGPNNGAPSDLCSATCTSIAPFEIEPNGSTATATPPWPGFSYWEAIIEPVGDHDYFSFTLAAPGTPTLLTHSPGDPTSCPGDTVLHLLDGNGNEILQDDDNGPGPCSAISPMLYPQVTNLPAGTYYAWVQRYQDSATIPLYQLDLTIQ
jgi:cysteine-rich repeat protein